MYVEKRFDRDGNIIENPKTCNPKFSEELKQFLIEVYSKDLVDLENNQSGNA